jgi:hypothetical protein
MRTGRLAVRVAVMNTWVPFNSTEKIDMLNIYWLYHELLTDLVT